jgi:hypothetical protein
VQQHDRAYHRRCCLRCGSDAQGRHVDTEEHCLFSCSYPALATGRAQLLSVLSVGRLPSGCGDLFEIPGMSWTQLRHVVRYVAYCHRWVRAFTPDPTAPPAPPPDPAVVDFGTAPEELQVLWDELFDSGDEAHLGIVGA